MTGLDGVKNDRIRNNWVRNDMVRNDRGLKMIGSPSFTREQVRIAWRHCYTACHFCKERQFCMNQT